MAVAMHISASALQPPVSIFDAVEDGAEYGVAVMVVTVPDPHGTW